jgi:hypothetical protein
VGRKRREISTTVAIFRKTKYTKHYYSSDLRFLQHFLWTAFHCVTCHCVKIFWYVISEAVKQACLMSPHAACVLSTHIQIIHISGISTTNCVEKQHISARSEAFWIYSSSGFIFIICGGGGVFTNDLYVLFFPVNLFKANLFLYSFGLFQQAKYQSRMFLYSPSSAHKLALQSVLV